MIQPLHVKTSAEREQFCSLTGIPGIPTLTPALLEQSRPDAHWMILGAPTSDGESILARCSLWWSNTPNLTGQRIGLIGHYAAREAEASIQLLQLACEELARHGCTLAVGPMDGTTHGRYRLVSDPHPDPSIEHEPPFFLEPQNPEDWPEHFSDSGFAPLAYYTSALQNGLGGEDSRIPELARGLKEQGITLRTLNAANFEDEIRRIYSIVQVSFRNNFLASPISEAEFIEQNRRLEPYVRPELVLLAERAGSPIGFLFAIPDWLQAQRGKTIDTMIIKTLAVLPDYSGLGLGTLLAGRIRQLGHQLGYRRAIHALMHERNLSQRISQSNNGQIIRRYTLYAKPLKKEAL